MDYDDYYADLNKDISSYTAISVNSSTLVFRVAFAKPSDISTDNTQPDYLLIDLLLPQLLVDAATFRSLDEARTKYEVKIGQQFSEDDLDAQEKL